MTKEFRSYLSKLTERLNDEAGAVLILVSIGFVALMATSALVVDLGMARTARSEARLVVDAAAAAGALDVGEGNGPAGCVSALGYVESNLGVRFAGADCSVFATICTASTAVATTADANGDWALTITYPVDDDSALMQQSAIGSIGQAIDLKDGQACERIGISLQKTQTNLFAGLFGNDTTVTTVHAVGATRASTDANTAVNLVILERYDCDAIVAEGSGGGTGGIWVDVVVHPDNTISPGYITVDADATGADCGPDGVMDVDGSNAQIRADGPEGCEQQIGSHVGPTGALVGEGCGIIRILAPGTPGCNPAACTSSGIVLPDPNALGRRVTRAPIDHRYNCKASYSFGAGWEIRPCPDAPAPHIDNLVAALGGGGAPLGYDTWTGLGHPCTVQGPPGTLITVTGNIYVDCPVLSIKRAVHLVGGNVVFAGDVTVEGQGTLAINGWIGDPLKPGLDAIEVFFRDGLLEKAGQATFIAHNATVYMSPTSMLTMLGGGNGTLIWTAPDVGDFAHLALWSDAPHVHDLAGQAYLDLRGVFFTPKATVLYRGNGFQHQVEAQFVTLQLKSQGQGVLILRPNFDAAVLIPDDVIQLIR